MRSDKYILVVYSVLILSPLLALPFIIYGIYHRYKGCLTALAVFMALMAFLTAPVGDLYRHTIIYYLYQNYSYEQFISSLGSDFIMSLGEYFMAKQNIPFEFLRLAYTFITYCILNYIFSTLISKSNYEYRKSEYFSRYLLTFLCIDFFTLVLGVRFTFAASVFILGIYLYLCERRNKAAFLILILSCCIHYSFSYYGLFVIMLIRIKMNKLTFSILIIFGLIISTFIISTFESFLLKNEMEGAGYLGDGKWAKGYREQQDLENVIYLYAKYIACIPITFYSIKRIREGRIYQYFLTLVLLIVLTFSLGSVCGRITTLISLGTPMLVLWDESINKRKMEQKYYTAIFLSMVLIYAATFYGMKNPRNQSDYQYIAAPTPIILTNHYDRIWIYQHVNNDGSGKYRDE